METNYESAQHTAFKLRMRTEEFSATTTYQVLQAFFDCFIVTSCNTQTTDAN